MRNRPLAIWILAAVAALAALSSLVIVLQFLGVIPWAGDEVHAFYGKWAGVFLYGLETVVLVAVAAGWLLLKPWAPMFTLIFALLGFFVPLMSYFAGTSLFSAALAPMILSAVIVLLATRPPVRQALAEAAAAQAQPKPAQPKPKSARRGKAPAAAPVVKGFRSDDV